MSEQTRTAGFQRNEGLEQLLNELNHLLTDAEKNAVSEFRELTHPVLLIVGAPRSGTTLTMQWLASSGQFSYPSNMLSRFYGAPYIGALIQTMLTSPLYNFRDELKGFQPELGFSSQLGKTVGALSPNEFFYFWRRFIPFVFPKHLSDSEMRVIKRDSIVSELEGLYRVFGKPFACKGLFLQYNIAEFQKMLGNLFFIHIQRHPWYNSQSLLTAREKYFGDRSKWYSVQPRGYEDFMDESPPVQVAWQIHHTNLAIEEGLAQIDSSRSLSVKYEEFCRDPRKVYESIRAKLAALGSPIDAEYRGEKEFGVTNEVTVSEADWRAIQDGFRQVSGGDPE